MRNINPALELIKEFEGLSLKPYLCPALVATIGYGSTRYENGTKVTMKDPAITEARAHELLKHDVKATQDVLENFLTKNKIKLNDNQFSALLCFAYNCGTGPILSEGKMFNKSLRTKGFPGIELSFLAYCKAKVNGKVKEMSGLKRRRKAEYALFCS